MRVVFSEIYASDERTEQGGCTVKECNAGGTELARDRFLMSEGRWSFTAWCNCATGLGWTSCQAIDRGTGPSTAGTMTEIAISCGDEGYSGGCCFTNGDQLWRWGIQWRLLLQKWRSAVAMRDTVAAIVTQLAISCGAEGYSGGCCYTNGDQLWEWGIQWRLLLHKWRSAVGMRDTVAAVVSQMAFSCRDEGYSGGSCFNLITSCGDEGYNGGSCFTRDHHLWYSGCHCVQ